MTGTCHAAPRLDFDAFASAIEARIEQQGRVGLLTARRMEDSGRLALVALLLDPRTSGQEVVETLLAPDATGFASMTERIPQLHWFERAIYDFFGLRPEGHPRCKSLVLHEAWPAGWYPLRDSRASMPPLDAPRREYPFLTVKGEGVYEIPVGPIHAGIIEPGHFRFSCLGEIIENLEIRLGYQHRGVEQRMTEVPWRHLRFLAEAASSDTSAANALAHAQAVEGMLGLDVSPLACDLRQAALELERISSHLGDLGGICADIGFLAGASIFSRLRGRSQGLAERLTGSRYLLGFVQPGGVARPLPAELREDLKRETEALHRDFAAAEPLLLDNPGALERMEGTGVVKPSLARDFGLVGPSARASGVAYDVRVAFPAGTEASLRASTRSLPTGDVLARVRIRAEETHESFALFEGLLARMPDREGPHAARLPERLPPGAIGVGIVEAWRGELIHMLFTDALGRVSRYCIKDPSFNNWTGLAIAARNELVFDFPLCNKSFGLSYSGNDL